MAVVCRLVVTAPIRPLAWEPPYAAGAAPEKAKGQKESLFSGLGSCGGVGLHPCRRAPWVKVSDVAAGAVQVRTAAWIQSLTQKLPYVLGVAIKKKKHSRTIRKKMHRVLAIVNSAAMNIGVLHVSFPISVCVSSGSVPRSGILGS